MKLEIILRTCDRGNISKFPRFIDVSKAELLLGCVASLINAANQLVSHHIHFKILDDNSSQETLHQLLQRLNHNLFLLLLPNQMLQDVI